MDEDKALLLDYHIARYGLVLFRKTIKLLSMTIVHAIKPNKIKTHPEMLQTYSTKLRQTMSLSVSTHQNSVFQTNQVMIQFAMI